MSDTAAEYSYTVSIAERDSPHISHAYGLEIQPPLKDFAATGLAEALKTVHAVKVAEVTRQDDFGTALLVETSIYHPQQLKNASQVGEMVIKLLDPVGLLNIKLDIKRHSAD